MGTTLDGTATAPWLHDGPWNVVSYLAVVPVLGLLLLWTATLGAGRVRLGTPLVLAVLAGLLVFLGTAAGVATAIEALDLDGTTWMTAQALLVLLGASLAALAGVAFWAPKLYGKLLPDSLTRLGATLVALGALVAAVPLAVAGALGQERLVAGNFGGVDSGDVSTVESLDLVSAIGLSVVVLGGLVVGLCLLARRRGEGPGDDPWEGHTLEWTTTSPPPVGNFATLPEITSEAPLYDSRHAPATATEGSA
jgi:heme/copper-type cytochrome/quinol oxidase subunit 1